MTVKYTESDADLRFLQGKNIGVIGYGNMGRSVAQNLLDQGLNVVVGAHSEESRERVISDRLPVAYIEDVVRDGHVLLMMLADEVAPQIYLEKISPNLQRDQALIFASGYNITFGFIEPPPFVDVGLVAPRTYGEAVRSKFLEGEGFYSFVAVGQDATGNIWNIVLAIAKAIGSLRAGAIEITMEQEAELDLFIQQAILPAVHHVLTSAATILLERGYPPEAAMMDLYVSGELNDYVSRASDAGLFQALRLLTLTGQYGIFTKLNRFKDLKMERLMEVTLDEIRDGRFSREWTKEYADGYPRLRKLYQNQEELELWDAEQQTIDMLHED